MIDKIKNLILENKNICILSFMVLLAILFNVLAQLFVFGGIALAVYYCVRNPQKIRQHIKRDFTTRNVLITILAVFLCAIFSFFIYVIGVFGGVTTGAGPLNYNGDKESWTYFFFKSLPTLFFMTGMFVLPGITALGLMGFWGNVKPKLSKFLMFSAPLTVLFFMFAVQFFGAVVLALSAIGFKIY